VRTTGSRLATSALAFLLAGQAHAATVKLVVNDAPGTGFNDPKPVAAVPGNPATTLGKQRVNAFQAAADIWGAKLLSNVQIEIGVQMKALECTQTSGVLGSAGASDLRRDFPGAPRAATYYVSALANSLEGADGDQFSDDLGATFNATLDEGGVGCLNGKTWWYGVNSPAPAGTIDFLGTVLHEICHGIGFATQVNGATGEKFLGNDDAFMVNLEDHNLGIIWPNLSDAQRMASATSGGTNLHWVGAKVTAESGGLLTTGANGQGHVQMYAPSPREPGSSVSHWDTALVPNELMEPSKNADSQDLVSTLALKDTGWRLATDPVCTYTVSPLTATIAAAGAGATASVTTTAGCAWTATSNAAFLTINSGATGTGSGTVQYTVAANTGAARTGTLTVAGKTVTVNQDAASGGGCTGTATDLCLLSGRFRVSVAWKNPYDGGTTGVGTAIPRTNETGLYWFFASSNIELMIKILDGRAANGHFWVFYGALSDVEYTITITDVQTSTTKTYFNPGKTLGSKADITAFAAAGRDESLTVGTPGLVDVRVEAPPVSASRQALAGCQTAGETLCLNASRFSVRVAWKNPYDGGSTGVGTAVGLTADTGAFWFFQSANLELIMKLLDGTAVNGKFWFAYGALSDVEYTITVTDTNTGTVKTYFNPGMTLGSKFDTEAF